VIDVSTFLEALTALDADGIFAAATELELQASSAAGEVSWWRATVEIDRQLRARCERRLGATAARQASTSVLHAAAKAGLDFQDPRVVAVARAASDVARGLVAGSAAADDLLRGCQHLCAA
jgi:hypothetical protein